MIYTTDTVLLSLSAAIVFSLLHGLINTLLSRQKQKFHSDDEKTDSSDDDNSKTFLRSLCKSNISESANRLVATTHALLSIVVGLIWIVREMRPCGSSLGSIQRIAIQISLGYFFYDTLFEIFKGEAYDMIIHHLFALCGLSWALFKNISGTEVLGGMFSAELSTPFLHMRYFLRHARSTPQGQKLFDAVSFTFFTIFLTSRCIVLGPLVTYFTIVSSTTPVFIKLCGLALFLVSLYWGVVLLRMARKRFKQ